MTQSNHKVVWNLNLNRSQKFSHRSEIKMFYFIVAVTHDGIEFEFKIIHVVLNKIDNILTMNVNLEKEKKTFFFFLDNAL